METVPRVHAKSGGGWSLPDFAWTSSIDENHFHFCCDPQLHLSPWSSASSDQVCRHSFFDLHLTASAEWSFQQIIFCEVPGKELFEKEVVPVLAPPSRLGRGGLILLQNCLLGLLLPTK